MTLPPKRERPRSGITRGPQRGWPRHRAWLRQHRCVCMRIDCAGRIEVAHVRSAANSGTGLKPADWWAVPLCQTCHRLQHEIGIATFEKQMQVDLAALAREFAKRSPDQAMRKAMKESEEWTGIPNLR